MSSRFIHVISGSSSKIFKSNIYMHIYNTIYINIMLDMRLVYIFLSSNAHYVEFFYAFAIWNFELSIIGRACNIISG